MAPEKRPPPKSRSKRRPVAVTQHDPDMPYNVVYFKRHKDDDANESVPGREFLARCPTNVRATMRAVLTQVAAAPPPKFAGGGKWEAMHGTMAGYHEVRVDGPGRRHYRLFCKLDTQAEGHGPLLTVLWGNDKAFRTKFPPSVYSRALALGREYLSRQPRSLA